MRGILVDSNIILDVFLDDPKWADWSESKLAKYSSITKLFINQVVYSEVSIGFKRIEELEIGLNRGGFEMLEIPKEALFLAGKAFLRYRKNRGTKRSPLPDFYIGAQAAILDLDLITRDESRYRTYFPTVNLISPQKM
ncbi:Membrane-associated protein containing RNA-binding TRAM domain and ribonuclease PIN-domain, YacL B.subtilis ortholog [Olavius algarvensis Delta 1 endosymbiont]|nr:Membrane-associated protein containing RNA-binding TRAM domain and ribonuclease PIN-domain, YacL B.subtilis ortholog [Olavius algarvensis Delta 1 endosymbiont]